MLNSQYNIKQSGIFFLLKGNSHGVVYFIMAIHIIRCTYYGSLFFITVSFIVIKMVCIIFNICYVDVALEVEDVDLELVDQVIEMEINGNETKVVQIGLECSAVQRTGIIFKFSHFIASFY